MIEGVSSTSNVTRDEATRDVVEMSHVQYKMAVLK